MLILTRNPGETIRIGNDISVTLLGVNGKQSRIGITAPAEIAVHREEIHQRIHAEQQSSVDKEHVNQISENGENVNRTTEKSSVVEPMHIDERVQMAANARRYEWLRDREIIEDPDTDILVMAGNTYFTGAELDKAIDDAMRLARLEELHPCEQ